MSKPSGPRNSLQWSPNGAYLALGTTKVEIWQLTDSKIALLNSFNEDFVDIKMIEWTSDSTTYACGGVSKTNVIRVRNIESRASRNISLPD